MGRLTVDNEVQLIPQVAQGVLMIHKEPPAMVVVVTEVKDELGFWGADIQDGTYMEWDATQFTPFIGKLTLEQ